MGIYSLEFFYRKEERLEISELKTQLKKSESIEQSSLSYTVGPCWLSMLHTAVCPRPSQTPQLSLPPSLPLVTIRLLQRIEQRSLCWTAGPWLLSTLNTAVCRLCNDINGKRILKTNRHICMYNWKKCIITLEGKKKSENCTL